MTDCGIQLPMDGDTVEKGAESVTQCLSGFLNSVGYIDQTS